MKLTNFPFKNIMHGDAYFWMSLMLNDLHPTYKIETKIFFFFMLQKQSPTVFCKKGFLENFKKFTRKHLCQSLFFNKCHKASKDSYHKSLKASQKYSQGISTSQTAIGKQQQKSY